MKKIAEKWVKFAKRDLEDAEVLFKNKRYFGCLYHCHQAIEKFLKAIINAKNKKVPKTHDLLRLLDESEIKYPKEIFDFIQELNSYYQPIRYPDTPEAVSLKLRQTESKKVFRTNKNNLKMAKVIPKRVKEFIKDYLKTLESHIKVERAILFGSYARGESHRDSDIDLIVISPDFKKMVFIKRLIWLSKMRKERFINRAMDIFGYTAEEFNKFSKESIVLEEAKEEGIVIK